jgi:hypothetical protein
VAALERLKKDLRCAPTDEGKRDALRYVVHSVGDIHQSFHTVDEARGGNDIPVEARIAGAKTCRGGKCPIHPYRSNLHTVWDGTFIRATPWDWSAYVDWFEGWYPKSPEASAMSTGGTPAEWAEDTHAVARMVWHLAAETHVLDDVYYASVLSVLDRQLSSAGLRLARFLNEAYSIACSP